MTTAKQGPAVRRHHTSSGIATALVFAAVLGFAAAGASAQINRGTPDEIEGVGIDQKLDAQIDLDLAFKDSEGRSVRLADYFKKNRPVILTLNYYRCPMLCTLLLDGMIDALGDVAFDPGDDYEMLTISFDPMEKPELARAKRRAYLAQFGHPKGPRGWHFLTGPVSSIKSLTDAVGFKFKWNERQQQWAHSAALIICTPDGRVSRYLPGILFEPRTVRLSLVEASSYRIGTFADQIFLTCFQWHNSEGQYTPHVMGMLRWFAALTVMALIVMFVLYRRLEASRRRYEAQRLKLAAAAAAAPGATPAASDPVKR